MRRLVKLGLVAVISLFASVFTSCTTPYYVSSDEQVRYDNPEWAPPYYQGVRYYYLPDIECYYDLSLRQFIYLDNGYWRYSRVVPSIYAGFNLYDCFSIALNVGVFKPWNHHHYYVSNYPRYYYRDYYDRSNIPYVRGYNENTRSAFFWRENERKRARDWNDESIRNGREFKYSKEDKARQIQPAQGGRSSRSAGNANVNRQQPNNNAVTPRQRGNTNDRGTTNNRGNVNERGNANDRGNVNERGNANQREKVNENANQRQQSNRSEAEKDSQSTNYYGKKIGQPVKVQKQMRSTPQNETRSNANSSSRSNVRSNDDSSTKSNTNTKSTGRSDKRR